MAADIDWTTPSPEQQGLLGKLLRACLENKPVIAMLVIAVIGWGVACAPFDWQLGGLWPRDPVPVDAIPDIGENQQIVFTKWPGRSPQDVEDQISYPLTVSLLGVPGVRTVRSFSMFGFSSIYIIFKDDVEFYWSRTRVLEKLNSLPRGTLPMGVSPVLGPDSTALGQVFWYTLEGRDRQGNPAGGWDLEELRTIQDWTVRYALLGVDGVSEVASIGGFVREYQIDVDPDAMRAFGVSLAQVYHAVMSSNIDVGARSIELNQAEYLIRGIGFVKSVRDIERSVIKATGDVPVKISDVATVRLGPALRRGALDKDGAEAVGGVVVARYGDNPLAVIKRLKRQIERIEPGLGTRVLLDRPKPEVERYAAAHGLRPYGAGGAPDHAAWLAHLGSLDAAARPPWVRTSQIEIVPFYDRSGLIYETLGTLNQALAEEILVTLIVVVVMVLHLRSSLLIGLMLPLTVLLCFIAMRIGGVDANIVALSGIAIAIGTIVDMGIVLCENILQTLEQAPDDVPRIEVVHRAASEVAGAVMTAVATTIVGFLPVFYMSGAEGKLFRPLAFTKTFALLSSIVIAITILPPAAQLLFCGRITSKRVKGSLHAAMAAAGLFLLWRAVSGGGGLFVLAGLGLLAIGVAGPLQARIPERWRARLPWALTAWVVLLVVGLLARSWEPLGPELGWRNLAFVGGLLGSLLGLLQLFQWAYPTLLRWCLAHKRAFLSLVALQLLFGLAVWIGFEPLASPMRAALVGVGVSEQRVTGSNLWAAGARTFPGLGREFMPPLDEGSYLYMPTTMVHASIGKAREILAQQGLAFRAIPEVESVVGKLGRADTPLDPAPISMIETVINYKSEYVTDAAGHRLSFAYDEASGTFTRDAAGKLVPDRDGRPFRQWRDHIKKPSDIWDEIVRAGSVPGVTSAPRLQPIAARIVMLQSGMRAPMGIKIKGPTLEIIEDISIRLETLLKQVEDVEPSSVVADRIVGKPYLEIVPDRDAIARYGIRMRQFQDVVEIAIGGRPITMTVEGRERFPVRIRYARELRDSIEAIKRILVPAPGARQIPLEQLARVQFVRGPQVIKSEDTFLTGYVLFDMRPGRSEVDVVEACQAHLNARIAAGELVLPAGVSYSFAGSYENQLRAQRTLTIVLPVALFAILFILYLQFRTFSTSVLIFSGIAVAFSGGFMVLWLYAQPWFLDVSVFGTNMRTLFDVHPINLSVAVWVGFLALFGIATDDGVVIGTYLVQTFDAREPDTVEAIREATLHAGMRRVRPACMTTATTILALIPILTSTGRGSDIMVPMAIPSFGGMLIEVLTMLVVPVLFCALAERRLNRG